MCINSNLFENIAKKIAKIDLTKLKHFCADKIDNEIVAKFSFDLDNHKASWDENGIIVENRTEVFNKLLFEKELKTFAIILESPHKEEFEINRDNKNGNHPACGQTAKMINRYFLDMINRYVPTICMENDSIFDSNNQIMSGTYRLVLINLVQYQCSLGEKTSKYRSKVLDECLKNTNFIEEFKNEIIKWKPDIILNACTENYKEIVWQYIDEIENECVQLQSCHPSSWFKYRALNSRKNK